MSVEKLFVCLTSNLWWFEGSELKSGQQIFSRLSDVGRFGLIPFIIIFLSFQSLPRIITDPEFHYCIEIVITWLSWVLLSCCCCLLLVIPAQLLPSSSSQLKVRRQLVPCQPCLAGLTNTRCQAASDWSDCSDHWPILTIQARQCQTSDCETQENIYMNN